MSMTDLLGRSHPSPLWNPTPTVVAAPHQLTTKKRTEGSSLAPPNAAAATTMRLETFLFKLAQHRGQNSWTTRGKIQLEQKTDVDITDCLVI